MSQVVLLVEDEHHRRLIYRYLIKCGFDAHAVRVQMAPSGVGSAEQWVRKTFPKELAACRTRQAETKLIVLIDADVGVAARRLTQLDEALREAGCAPLGSSDWEKIARLVPKRNVETWILCLNGQGVDEVSDYRRANADWSSLIAKAAAELYAWTRADGHFPKACVASLSVGIGELGRARLV